MSIFVIFMLMAFYAVPVFAFAPNMLMDGDFLEFTFVNVPFITIIAMTGFDFFYYSYILKHKFSKEFSSQSLFSWLMRANLFGMLFNEVVVVILIYVLMNLFSDEDTHEMIIQAGIIYFAFILLLFAWDFKVKRIAKVLGEKKLEKSLKIHILATTMLAYGAMYGYLYYHIF